MSTNPELASLRPLLVIDRLEVGLPVVEKDRISAAYRVTRGEETVETDLAFRYGEPVFDPQDRGSQNLAAMVLAQVAMNYGLFCREIVFRGPFDRVDIRFISDMVENTSREIYVNKILAENPFLKGEAAEMRPTKLPRYTQADLIFPDRIDGQSTCVWPGPAGEAKRVGVLSSGGKESLLSYGLLDEMGYEVHPLFGNESGRHWFTAINAFRHFEQHIPRTARVWISADRVFSFMLRSLPFIREDFGSVRADMYPIRLWTVGVFVFAMLPLARKRGLGRLVIGCEYDTTRRLQAHGITHYDGLYDQSRFFDGALSRYYHRKHLALSQFSMLRPVSEYLVQHTLASRFPDLQKHQVSCHATIKDDERVRPCGKCEKCRRVVGMLVAAGHDPARCGYTPDQVRDCLAALQNKGIHQSGADARHLLWLLAQRGAIPANFGKPHPEVQKLRFDSERSPVDGLPVDLRAPLFSRLLEYADGAVARSGRQWIPVDPLDPEKLSQPYPFGPRLVEAATRATSSGAASYLWANMSWPEAKERLKEVDVALLPVGAIEQHGHHLPLDVDTFDAEYLARAVAARCKDPRPLVLPTVPYGVSYHHDDYPGTLSIGNDTLARLIYDIGMSAARNGISKLVIINGHGGNGPTLNFAAQTINRDANIFVCVDTGESSDSEIAELIETPNDVHAGEIETSTTLAVRPEVVDMARAEEDIPRFSSTYLDFTTIEGVPWYAATHKLSRTGTMGDPTKATVEKGEKIWEIMIRNLTFFVEELKGMTLDEIHQKRY